MKQEQASLRGVMARRLRSFGANEKGFVLPVFAISLVALLGLTTLAHDVSILFNLQTQLQKAADAFALSGAAELDGRPDSITRAENAINTILANQNSSVWGGADGLQVTVQSRTYLTRLPAQDKDPNVSPYVVESEESAADQRSARFLRVAVTPVTIRTFFPATMFGAASNQMTTGASAVAGFRETVCRFTPVYICNPYENGSPTIYDAVKDPRERRRELSLKQGPHSSSSCPGNFGFLTVGDNGAKALREALAAISPPACYSKENVVTKPGNITSASDALNVRFDLYEGSAGGMKNANYPPATNVRKGYYRQGGACNQNAYECPSSKKGGVSCPTNLPFAGLGPDSGVTRTLCGGTVGNGMWDIEKYWTTNHSSSGRARPAGWDNGSPPSRYEVYKYEISQGFVQDPSLGEPGKTPETGAPACNAPGVATPDRRIIYGAVVNCLANADKFNGSAELPVETFAKFFLTRPVDSSNNNIYAELVGLVDPNTDEGVLHDSVQLYR